MVRERGVSVLQVVPSLLGPVLDAEQERCAEGASVLTGVRWLSVTGEALPLELWRRVSQQAGGWQLLNAYGPTECSDDVSHAVLPAPQPGDWRAPIGSALANTQLYVLDEQLEPMGIGMTGEIFVGGAGVGRGYLGEPERTAEVFVPDPYSQQAGSRLYRTGDRGRYRADGQLEYLGRQDGQVKLRGNRIELGEIEAVLRQHVGVREAVVLREERAEPRLLAYVVARGEQGGRLAGELREYLHERLPAWMQPSAFIELDALPVLASGKVDRRALPPPQEETMGQRETEMELWRPLEELVATVWQEVLGQRPQQREAHFFELGGHSLLATQVVARVRQLLQVEVPLRLVFEEPTVRGFAWQLEQLQRGEQALAAPPLVPVSRQQRLPLSFAQQRLWFLDQLEPGNTAYNVSSSVSIHGQLNVLVLEQCLSEVLQRHESLRTTFQNKGGRAIQIIGSASAFHLSLVDLRNLRPERCNAELNQLTASEAARPFDLTRDLLLRALLLRVGEDEHVLILTVHHIAFDGWSSNILVREITSLYEAFVQGKPSPLAPLPVQYADFAVWQRNWLQGDVLQVHLDYWKRQLRGAVPLELPADRPRTDMRSYHGTDFSFTLPPELSASLIDLGRFNGATTFMTLLAAFQSLLYRFSGQTDIVVGTDIANRNYVETEELIGFFVNLLALRTKISGTLSFQEVLRQVRQVVLEAYAHQDVPFDLLVEELNIERGLNQTPLINVLFVLQNIPWYERSLPGLTLTSLQQQTMTAKFDLALFMQEGPQGLRGTVNYNVDLFDASTIASLISCLQVLLQNIVGQPDLSLDAIEIYTEAEKERREKEKQEMQRLHLSRLRSIRGL